jgi:hypothetical protein
LKHEANIFLGSERKRRGRGERGGSSAAITTGEAQSLENHPSPRSGKVGPHLAALGLVGVFCIDK